MQDVAYWGSGNDLLPIYAASCTGFVALTCVALILRRRNIGKHLSTVLLVLLCIGAAETASVAALFVVKGKWIWNLRNPNFRAFERDPYLIARPIPSIKLSYDGTTISHNELGFRGKPPDPSHRRIRIVAIGGSTTYGVKVNDDETWPAALEGELGERYEVLNLGVPAHGTTEHLAMLAFHVKELQPDIIVLNTGLNDLHVLHSPGLRSDYSNVHAKMVIGNLGQCFENKLPRVGLLRTAVMLSQAAGLYPPCEYDSLEETYRTPKHTAIDERAASLYRRNLATLIALAKRITPFVVVVPQIIVRDVLRDGGYQWWTPYIEQRALPDVVRHYNALGKEVCDEEGAVFASEVLSERWVGEQFADHSHLNAAGNRRLGRLIAVSLEHTGLLHGAARARLNVPDVGVGGSGS